MLLLVLDLRHSCSGRGGHPGHPSVSLTSMVSLLREDEVVPYHVTSLSVAAAPVEICVHKKSGRALLVFFRSQSMEYSLFSTQKYLNK